MPEGAVEGVSAGAACMSLVNSPGGGSPDLPEGATGGIWRSEATASGGLPRTIVNSPIAGGGGEGVPPGVSSFVHGREEGSSGAVPVRVPQAPLPPGFSPLAEGIILVASKVLVPDAACGAASSTAKLGIEPAGASMIASEGAAGRTAGAKPTVVTSGDLVRDGSGAPGLGSICTTVAADSASRTGTPAGEGAAGMGSARVTSAGPVPTGPGVGRACVLASTHSRGATLIT
jgi:hypothetical protein